MINLLVAALIFFSAHAQDTQIYIDVGQGKVKKSLVALPPPRGMEEGDFLYRVVQNDLKASGLFDFVAPAAYLEDPAKVGLMPAPGTPGGFNFQNWKTIGAEFLFRGEYKLTAGQIRLETHVYHVPTARQVMIKIYEGPAAAARRLAHTFANDLVQSLTGKRGIFLTKIAVSRQDDPLGGAKEIFVMDWDAANPVKLTNHQTISTSPAWSNKGDKIAYTCFEKHPVNKVRNPDLFIYDFTKRKSDLVSYRKGLNTGATFLPDDLGVILTMSFRGNSDLYRLSLDGLTVTGITDGPIGAFNVEPAISPDGTKLAFSTDRLGNTHIFISELDGTKPKRLTMVGKLNSTPAWSPDGKTLAFAGDSSGHFDIFTIGADGQNMKRLTDARKASGRAANNESPSWSPDGRHILFTSDRTGNYQLFMITADGSDEYRITRDAFIWNKPKWSPYLE